MEVVPICFYLWNLRNCIIEMREKRFFFFGKKLGVAFLSWAVVCQKNFHARFQNRLQVELTILFSLCEYFILCSESVEVPNVTFCRDDRSFCGSPHWDRAYSCSLGSECGCVCVYLFVFRTLSDVGFHIFLRELEERTREVFRSIFQSKSSSDYQRFYRDSITVRSEVRVEMTLSPV